MKIYLLSLIHVFELNIHYLNNGLKIMRHGKTKYVQKLTMKNVIYGFVQFVVNNSTPST